MLDIHENNGQIALKAAGLFDQFLEIIHVGGQATRILAKDGQVHFEDHDDGTGGRPEVLAERFAAFCSTRFLPAPSAGDTSSQTRPHSEMDSTC